jgi:hypothetical protein
MAVPKSILIADRYALELLWRPLISSGAVEALAMARAREEGAKEFVHDGKSGYVGLADLGKRRNKKSRAIYALGAMAAKAYPGRTLFALAMPENAGWWIGGANNGMPTLDKWYQDDATAVQAIHDALAASPEAANTYIYGDPTLGIDGLQPLDLSQLSEFESFESTVRGSAKKLPGWIYITTVALIAFAAYDRGIPAYKAYQESQNPTAAPTVDAVAEWKAANAKYLKTIRGPMNADMAVIRAAIYSYPVMVGGWSLENIICAQAPNWKCKLLFRRPVEIFSSATNRTFEDARPASWAVAWPSGTEALVTVEVPGDTKTSLAIEKHVLALATYQVDTYSEFQNLSKIFAKVQIGNMARADVTAPVGPDGQPVARPAPSDVPEIFKADVAMSGPLRNLELIEQAAAPVFWREITVSRAAAAKPGLQLSEFQTNLRGDIYAKSR